MHADHDVDPSSRPLQPRSTSGNENASAPVVHLTYATFQGVSADGVDSFLGMPFAQPPVGDLRFRRALPPLPMAGIQNATSFGSACPQQSALAPGTKFPALPGLKVSLVTGITPASTVNSSEDCLFINVVRPSNLSTDARVPVVVWFYGGGLQKGDASPFAGGPIVQRSIGLNQPVIFVSLNYRLNAFGFLAGQQVKDAGVANLGLHDQRLALQWIQEHIPTFGGDPSKVIIWGQSAGASSATAHMAAFDGDNQGLFSGAVLESGFTKPTFDTASPQAQATFDQIASAVNCSSGTANKSANETVLDCLRAAPFKDLVNAVQDTPSFFSFRSLNFTWAASIDGVMFKRSMRESFEQGLFAKVPILAGDCDDEGTLFSLFSVNITTNQDFLDYIKSNYLVGANDSQIAAVGRAYPDDPTQGSPFDTGTNNSVTPQFKRIAAFQTDYTYASARRNVLKAVSQTQNAWSWLYKRSKEIPVLGSSHETDLQTFFKFTNDSDFVGTDALINFAHRLDPNAPANDTASRLIGSAFANLTWPTWNSTGHPLLTFQPVEGLNITADNFRKEAMDLLSELQAALGQ
ncbi:hypothetical protein PLICRDRAFT_113488 [Plicaturopsis crispa FD-325 SS-3]|nr:hypothetical protein PLICRDRAFT_113488 [Plicaturopsis crispa FD-325 SS-3]